MNSPSTVQQIPTKDLAFDPQNPRFFRMNETLTAEAVVEEMLDDESVQDLIASIGQKGYFEGEPLLVVQEDGKFVVVEGNRRLTAVKLLNGELAPPDRRKTSIAILKEEAIQKAPTQLPCIIYPERKDVMRYLGYRHITGIKEWDSLSKAKYLRDIRDMFYKEMPQADQLKALAKDIGSRSDYVGKLLVALNLYVTAENNKFFKLPMESKDVEFSYLTTAIGYSNIVEWLGLDGASDIEMPGLQEANLKSLFSCLFSKDQQGRTIIGESRNLADLAEIVAEPAAIEALEETGKLAEAYLYSSGPQSALQTSLEKALSHVNVCWSMLLKTKPLLQSHLDMAEKLFDGSRSIRNHLRNELED